RRGPERGRNRRVRQTDHGPDTGMPRSLDEEDVVVAERLPRRANTGAEILDDLAGDVRLREPARDVDRAHRLVRLGQAEALVHQDGVLVGGLAVVDPGSLAHRLHEAGLEA